MYSGVYIFIFILFIHTKQKERENGEKIVLDGALDLMHFIILMHRMVDDDVTLLDASKS